MQPGAITRDEAVALATEHFERIDRRFSSNLVDFLIAIGAWSPITAVKPDDDTGICDKELEEAIYEKSNALAMFEARDAVRAIRKAGFIVKRAGK